MSAVAPKATILIVDDEPDNRFALSHVLAELEQKGILVDFAERSGENICTAYHSEAFLRSLGHLGLDLIDYLPGGARDASEQDIVLYRRR